MSTTDGAIDQKLFSDLEWIYHCLLLKTVLQMKRLQSTKFYLSLSAQIKQHKKGRHCCSVGELQNCSCSVAVLQCRGPAKITFASTCLTNAVFNVLFLVLDFPLGAPNTLLKHVIERSIWRIVVGEGSWWGWGFSQDWWLGFWSCWNLSLTAVFWIDFSVACFKRV